MSRRCLPARTYVLIPSFTTLIKFNNTLRCFNVDVYSVGIIILDYTS